MNSSFSYANKYLDSVSNTESKNIIPNTIHSVNFNEIKIISLIIKYLNKQCIVCNHKQTIALTSKTILSNGEKYNHNVCKCSNCNQVYVIVLGIEPNYNESSIKICFNTNNPIYRGERDLILKGDMINSIYLLGIIIDDKLNIFKFTMLGLFNLYFGNNSEYINNSENKYYVAKLSYKQDHCDLRIGDIVDCKNEVISEEIKKMI